MNHIYLTQGTMNDELYNFYKDRFYNHIFRENDVYYFNDEVFGEQKIGNYDDLRKWLKDTYIEENKTMKNYNIKTATAIYTGGNIYIYYGQLENGLYFRACDDWDFISICNADTGNYNDDGFCDADYPEFYDEHEINTINGYQFEEFFNDMILWIMHQAPDGNYNIDELEKRMITHIGTNIEIENAKILAKSIQERVKQEKFEKMLKHQISSIESCMSEFRNDCNFFFADGSYYKLDFEKQWREEFYNSAVRLFEQKGYRIVKHGNYTLIKW